MALSHPTPQPERAKDLLNRTFGRLTVIAFAGMTRKNQSRWLCQCSCHEKGWVVVNVGDLTSGNTTSCGCAAREARERAGNRTTHGLSYTRAYGCWRWMLARCYNPKVEGYERYGARGITVCDRWRNSVENFYEDMGECPPDHELDRIDPRGSYTPDNCRWADQVTQARNKINLRTVTHNGQTKTAAEWAEITGIKAQVILSRIDYGWDVSDSLSVVPDPLKSRPRKQPYKVHGEITHNGRTLGLAEWSRETGISESTLFWRRNRGWPADKILSTPANAVTTHGKSTTEEYRIWRSIKSRCLNPNNRQYSDYGGRGITICDRWVNSFENFLADMGERPHGTECGRKDPNAGFSAENCKWMTGLEIARNHRDAKKATINGETKTVAEWCDILGLKFPTVLMRIHRGMSHEDALTKPFREKPRRAR